MNKNDNRKLTPDAQATIRRKVVAAVHDGMTKVKAAEVFNVSRTAVYKWLNAHEEGGGKNLKPKKRGPKEKPTKLQGTQAAQICNIIKDRHPEQMKLPFGLWNARAVRGLIKRKHNVEFTTRYVQILLKRWGFTPQKPKRIAHEKNPAAVEQWLQKDYPAIKKRAKAEKTSILWGDETGIRSADQLGRTYSLCGQTPVVKSTGKRFRCNMISALSNRGRLEFMIFKSSFTSKIFLQFLQRLVRDSRRKVFLIVDGHPAHKSEVVRTWLSENGSKLELFFLPPYSPDLNPDEFLNTDLKTNAVRNRVPSDQASMIRNVRSHITPEPI